MKLELQAIAAVLRGTCPERKRLSSYILMDALKDFITSAVFYLVVLPLQRPVLWTGLVPMVQRFGNLLFNCIHLQCTPQWLLI